MIYFVHVPDEQVGLVQEGMAKKGYDPIAYMDGREAPAQLIFSALSGICGPTIDCLISSIPDSSVPPAFLKRIEEFKQFKQL